MVKKIIIWIGAITCIVAVGIVGFVWWGLSNMSTNYIIHTHLSPERTRIPAPVIDYYLYNFRSDKNELSTIENEGGMVFLLEKEAGEPLGERQVKYAKFLLSKGLDINAPSGGGIAIIHTAVMQNDAIALKFILANGGISGVKMGLSHDGRKTKYTGMDAIELAYWWQENAKINNDRSEIIEILKAGKQSGRARNF